MKKLENTELVAQTLVLQNTNHMSSGSRFEHQAELIQIWSYMDNLQDQFHAPLVELYVCGICILLMRKRNLSVMQKHL